MENKDILEYGRPYIEDELDLYFKENPVETVYKRYQELAISNYLDIVAMHKLEYMHDYLLKYYTGHINYLFNCGKSHSIESRLKDIKELYDRHNNKYSIEDFEEYIKGYIIDGPGDWASYCENKSLLKFWKEHVELVNKYLGENYEKECNERDS